MNMQNQNMKKENTKKNSVSNFTKAFTLIEALVAISILMIALASPMTLAQKGISTAELSKDQMTASFLAQDGIEAVKNIRDQIAVSQTSGDWLAGAGIGNASLKPCICDPTKLDPNKQYCSFDTPLPNHITFCQIDTTAISWIAGTNGSNSSIHLGVYPYPPLNIHSTQPDTNGNTQFLKYDYGTGANETPSKFTRYINIIQSTTNPNEAAIHVRVTWPSPLGLQKIDITDYIYNYSADL